MDRNALKSRRPRRSYTAQFKAEMVAQCLQGDVSIASLAVDHGMNPNVLHRWVMEHERYGKHSLDNGTVEPCTQVVAPADWIPLVPVQPASQGTAVAPTPSAAKSKLRDESDAIQIELAGRGLTMTVRWPVDDHQGLARWARELLT